MKALLLGIVLMVWLPAALGETPAQALARAEALQDEGRYADAIAVLEPFAAQADGELAFGLAYAHLLAAMNSVRAEDASTQDIGEARKWINRTIELGNPAAYQLLYWIYKDGFGVPADMETAVDFLRRGVAQGEAGAKTNLALLAYRGVPPVAKNLELAARYFKELAQGDPTNAVAVYYLGVMQYRGQGGMPADEKAGLEKIEIAAHAGLIEAETDMGEALELGWAGREIDLPAALDWYEKAARKGGGHANWRIGLAYAEGRAGVTDPGRAVDYFRDSADAGNRNGMTSLGVMYATGAGVERDFAQARHWYEKAIENGGQHALKNLAYMYLKGQGVEVDLVRAWVLAKEAEQADIEQATSLVEQIEQRMAPGELETARRRLADGSDP